MKKSYLSMLILLVSIISFTVLKSHAQSTLMHFWYFDANIPNDTPLTSIDATYSITGENVRIVYNSALQGYPFTNEHANWRKASLERRNAPTPINYRPAANAGIAYNASAMRGIQVKQPFSGDGGQNTLIFHVPTTGYQDIVFQFAAVSTGAANALIIDYAHSGENWINTGLNPTTYGLSDSYNLFTVDLSDISQADNNAELKIRIRFQGPNLTVEEGQTVNFNNFSIEGSALAGTNQPPIIANPLELQGLIQGSPYSINLNDVFSDPDDDPLAFTALSSNSDFAEVSVSNGTLNITPLRRGAVQITLTATDGQHDAITHVFRALIYPAAHNLSQGNFTFTSWNSNEPDYAYPDNMIFLQSDIADPKLETELLFPYAIPENDYHADDIETVGFPYNNTARTRINGLGEEGIAFLNTGRNRDLGGALVAINTVGQQNLGLSFLAGTLVQNQRIYAIRLQYRVGTTGAFTDITSNGFLVQYVASPDGNTRKFDNIALPAAILNQEYVQLLWRYYHSIGDSGPRSQLRLDDIVITQATSATEADIPALRLFAADRKLFVETPWESSFQIEVFNIAGQKLLSKRISGVGLQNIDADFTPGVYIVTLQSAAQSISRKVVIQ